jgi:hypothetical protein
MSVFGHYGPIPHVWSTWNDERPVKLYAYTFYITGFFKQIISNL